ncbi:acetylornithine transaminase [Desulfovirgula thermocuniculi]|uniref:acetylornithine transaminase n=1 Tax=Desulfovirgula thermocuniculi TaxID=348842 RepID=UPI0004010CAD|nr:acetylornithine transaminase [Desulfovirgula thermocuniculi]
MNTAEIIQLTEKYVLPTYGRLPLAPVRGEGARVWDAEGREYLDFVGGIAVCSLGHCHPAVVKAICEQASRLMHVSNLYYIEPQARLARLLVENSCGDKVFFCNSGAEAVEAAIKLARKYGKLRGGPQKHHIVTAERSFHGRTMGAVTATGQAKYREPFDPLVPGFSYVPFNDVEALSRAVGPHTCAVILEPVQGEGGVRAATREFLAAARELCDRYDALLIFDEVQCGLGRTGKLFAYEHYGVEPDAFTLAKALGGGFPIGALVVKERAAIFAPGDHASTFGGNPLACAAALAAVESIIGEGLVENAARVGEYFKERLVDLSRRFNLVREVRGLGLMLGMELAVEGKAVVAGCQERGLLINCVDNHVLRFLPPLVVTERDVDRAVNILAAVLAEVG